MPEAARDRPLSPQTHLILGTGGMPDAVRAFDWSKTPLGAIEDWPQSLRTVVNILLTSRYAMWLFWGGDLTFICNDAYRPTLGIKDSWALGARADQVWAEIWPDIGPRIESVLTTGQATYDEGLLLFLERSGFPEETYHTFSYSPIADDDGRINGMLCVVTEETDRLLGERRVQTLRDPAKARERDERLLRARAEDRAPEKLRYPPGGAARRPRRRRPRRRHRGRRRQRRDLRRLVRRTWVRGGRRAPRLVPVRDRRPWRQTPRAGRRHAGGARRQRQMNSRGGTGR